MAIPQRALSIATMLRARGIKAEFDPLARSTGADALCGKSWGASAVLFEGEDEKQKGEVLIRSMQDGAQKAYPFERAMDALEAALTKFTWA